LEILPEPNQMAKSSGKGQSNGNWPEFPNVVGVIDSTPHQIYQPLSEAQRPFYSGHRHYHCMNTQLVIDNEGNIRFVQAGFLGSTHDATSHRLIRGGGAFWNMGRLIIHKVKHIPQVYSYFPKCLLRCSFARANFFAMSTVSNVSYFTLL